MKTKFRNHIAENLPFLSNSKLLIAVSGGIDSVVLAHLCMQAKLNISLAHCNFNLRGDESNADEDFVLQLAEDWHLDVFIENFDTENHAKTHKLSTQVAARELRYNWFSTLAQQLDFDYILTAHHADDSLETILINLTRGTGLDGLTGIPEVNFNIVRPLLPFSREAIENYAKENHLHWREDSSNLTNKYLRNRLRHEVIPRLKSIHPQLLHSVSTTVQNLHYSRQIIEDAMVRVQKKVVTVDGEVIKLNIKKLQKLSDPKIYLYQLLKEFNFTNWDDVAGLLTAQSGKQVFSATHRLLKDRTHLLLAEIISKETSTAINISDSDTSVTTPFGTMVFGEVNAVLEKSVHSIFVDKDKLHYPLTIRKWEQGDVFYPIGMVGKKKLSKYFKDEKLSLIDKENVWVLCSNNAVVWVVGMRADERFKVTPSTKAIVQIKAH
ncbi:MAG TPA: tRNA lysidine(34) synthetase TilS [Aquaticitalea sp.]|nr:tRNA lysidine(34) synthetase TilS [Aquaticitalea sp.]